MSSETASSTSRAGRAVDAVTLFGFDGPFLRKLERLAVINKRPLAGASTGPRRSVRRGSSVEFADFREYSPGDDFRRIDWKAYGRLDRLFVRLYTAEEIATVTLFIDRSSSMTFGEPSKLLFAGRLAAIFSHVALHSYDMAAVAGWGEKLDAYYPPRGGAAAIPDVWNHIADLVTSQPSTSRGESEGMTRGTNFKALRDWTHLTRSGNSGRSGISIVLTDVLTDSDWRGGIRALRGAGQEVSLIQILAPEELNPGIRGDWKLIDAESNREIEITVSQRLLKRYHEELDRHTGEIETFCRRQGVTYLQMTSDASIAGVVLGRLHSEGMLA